MKLCKGPCGKHKEISEYTIERYSKKGEPITKSLCKICSAEKKREYYQNNKEHCKKINNDQYYRRKEENKNLDPYAAGGTKWCNDCKQERAVTDFYICPGYAKGLDVYCKYHSRSRSSTHKSGVGGKGFNITKEQYDELYKMQDGVCCICSQLELNGKDLAVDHDHETGTIRGLLCFFCNSAIGKFKHDPDIVFKAFEYLRIHMAR